MCAGRNDLHDSSNRETALRPALAAPVRYPFKWACIDMRFIRLWPCYGEMRMRVLITLMLAAVGLYAASAPALALKDNDVFGKWRDVESGGLLEIYPCGGAVCIKIAQVTKPGVPKDVNNPDRALRNRPLLGVVIMADGTKSGPAVWGGHLYNTQDGRTYKGSIKLVSEKKVKVSGCVLGGLICSGREWRKVGK
jgi:uncharacterized protein (DUF2147 family)